jgi:hypothetical protein
VRPTAASAVSSAYWVAVPSLILLAWLQRRGHFDELGPVKV